MQYLLCSATIYSISSCAHVSIRMPHQHLFACLMNCPGDVQLVTLAPKFTCLASRCVVPAARSIRVRVV